jgi:16S rRNA (uracil1498-N3)-methyltransferase
VQAPAGISLRQLQKEHALILLNSNEFFTLEKQESLPMPVRHREHFLKVLRRRVSWSALVSDGSGRLCTAEVSDNALRLLELNLSATEAKSLPHPRVSLVQAWIKPKSLATVLQKSAELGAEALFLAETERCHDVQEKESRIDAILENACMQAYNPIKPKVMTGKLTDWLATAPEATFFGDLAAESKLTEIQRSRGHQTAFVNGPEGGFSETETALLRGRAQGVLLSENVLRSETAAIIALGYLCL